MSAAGTSHRPRHALQRYLRLRCPPIAPGCYAGHSDLHDQGGRLTLGHQHGLRFPPRAQVSALPSKIVAVTDTSTVPGCSRAMDPETARDCSGAWTSSWPWAAALLSRWPQVLYTLICKALKVVRPSGTNMASGVNPRPWPPAQPSLIIGATVDTDPGFNRAVDPDTPPAVAQVQFTAWSLAAVQATREIWQTFGD